MVALAVATGRGSYHNFTVQPKAFSFMHDVAYPHTVHIYKIACAFGGLAIPPGMYSGMLVIKNVHLDKRSHSLASCSKSNISPSIIPHPASPTSCRSNRPGRFADSTAGLYVNQ